MSKRTRQQKKEEEARIIAEMEEAMKEATAPSAEADGGEETDTNTDANTDTAADEAKRSQRSIFDPTPEQIHCRRCKTLLGEDGVCPTCGFHIYMPMNKEKQSKIKLVATVVLMVAFVALFVILQIVRS